MSLFAIVGSQIVAHTLIETGNGPNRPNTIDLWESGLKNWASSGFYNSYWSLGVWPRTLKHTNGLRFYVRGVRFRRFLVGYNQIRGVWSWIIWIPLGCSFGATVVVSRSLPFSHEGFIPLYSPSLFDLIVHLSVIQHGTESFHSLLHRFWFSGDKDPCQHCSGVFST